MPVSGFLMPAPKIQSHLRGSNPVPFPYQGNALPTELRRHLVITGAGLQSGRRDLNPQPSRWQRDALPIALHPHSGKRSGIRTPRPSSLRHARFPEPSVGFEPTTCRLRNGRSTSGAKKAHEVEGLYHLSYTPRIDTLYSGRSRCVNGDRRHREVAGFEPASPEPPRRIERRTTCLQGRGSTTELR